VAAASGLIGPNALTQLLPVLERAGGAELRERLLARAGVVDLPDMTGLIDEAPVARLHQAMRAEVPDLAPGSPGRPGCGRRTTSWPIASPGRCRRC
jgi:divinyl protochlorophyllide a 8-vinyl-reductase